MQKIFVYGSLRKGQYNFDRFPSAKYLSTHKVQGWDLYSLYGGSYPGIKPGEGTLEVDLLEVDDADYESIRRMELGAGYSEIEIDVEGTVGKFYPYENSVSVKVPSGNWNNFKNNN